ncbi:amidase [Bauldia sp.]|uniref:amidase n=1 Tax=Bauldia sp. TaxID=2575872 RepID=UPI003BAA2740
MLIDDDPVRAFIDYPDVPVANAADGPLAGTTFAVKDIFDVAGYPTGCGNPLKRAEAKPATEHAPAVAALLNAGSRFVGKVHTAELAFSLDGVNSHFGTPLNPAAPDRVPGGSSSGSASAVAAGLVDIALGSDTGGSVRGPASFCGIVGLRPTHERVSLANVMPLAESLDTGGWFTRDLDLYERVAAVMLGEDVAGPPLTRMIVAEDAFANLAGDPEATALTPALDRLKAAFPDWQSVILAPDGLASWQQAFRTIQGYEAWKAHGPWIEARNPPLMEGVRGRFEIARQVTDRQYRTAEAQRESARDRVLSVLGDDGFIVVPTFPTVAPRLTASVAELEKFRNYALMVMCIAGLARLPQISLPVATVHGAPLGLSLIGPPHRDRALISLGRIAMGEDRDGP